jgi:hypothetical protein
MSDLVGRLRQNLDRVRERMGAACARAGRAPEGVLLVAVTKTVGPRVADALIELGVSDIGENRVQDALAKAAQVRLAGAVRWHMIGHLQRNKVKPALGLFEMVHSVDSVRLAEEIDRVAASRGRAVSALLEVNVSGEASKYGLRPDEVAEAARQIGGLGHVALEGLMTMAPLGAPEREVRGVFAGLRELSQKLAALGLPGVHMKHLSMGMTQDFEIAIEEGATMVRVGSALFEGIG